MFLINPTKYIIKIVRIKFFFLMLTLKNKYNIAIWQKSLLLNYSNIGIIPMFTFYYNHNEYAVKVCTYTRILYICTLVYYSLNLFHE